MTPAQIRRILNDLYAGNKHQFAADMRVTVREVNRWLDGTRPMGEIAKALLSMILDKAGWARYSAKPRDGR